MHLRGHTKYQNKDELKCPPYSMHQLLVYNLDQSDARRDTAVLLGKSLWISQQVACITKLLISSVIAKMS